MENQTTNQILMIRPVRFGFNAQTAVNNAFQVADINQIKVQQQAVEEFDSFVDKLRNAGIDVTVIQDSDEPHTPDSIFPNNWISFHHDGSIIFYPMYAENRRKERKQHVIDTIREKFNILSEKDFGFYEAENHFLEGTGSMVLDRENKIAYACISPRTDAGLLQQWCDATGYRAVIFDAADENGTPVYHTNVLMCVADRFVVICLEAISRPEQREMVINAIGESGKAIIPIRFKQMNHFAGNMLQVHNNTGEKILVMSQQAWNSLPAPQQMLLKSLNKVLYSNLNTIETNGGGSARCMMAEVHIAKR